MKGQSGGITAITLVNSIIEFVSMTNGFEWSYEKLQSNTPRLIRLRRIESLIHAFIPELNSSISIKEKLEQVISGDFILLRAINNYKGLEEEIIKEIDNSRFSLMKKEDLFMSGEYFRLRAIGDNFRRLFQYKTHLNKLLSFNSGFYEISYLSIISVAVTDSVSEQIDSSKIDNFLTLMISPERKSFSENDLIKNYHYPQADLFEIDLDWM